MSRSLGQRLFSFIYWIAVTVSNMTRSSKLKFFSTQTLNVLGQLMSRIPWVKSHKIIPNWTVVLGWNKRYIQATISLRRFELRIGKLCHRHSTTIWLITKSLLFWYWIKCSPSQRMVLWEFYWEHHTEYHQSFLKACWTWISLSMKHWRC